MPTYRLKPAVKRSNYCPVLSLGTFGETLRHLQDNMPGYWRHTVDETTTGERPLDGVPEWLSEVEGYSIEEAKRLILDFLGFTRSHFADTYKLQQVPNFLPVVGEDFLPVNWGVRMRQGGSPDLETPIGNVLLCAGTGASHGDDIYLYYDGRLEEIILNEFRLTDVLTMGDFWALPVDTQYDIIVKLFEYGPSDRDVYPDYSSEFFCGLIGRSLPFTTIYSDLVSTAPVTIFMQAGDEDKWVVLRFIEPTTTRDSFGFAGGFEILSEDSKGELINEGFEVEGSQISESSPGLYSSKCGWEMLDGGEPTTLEKLYTTFPDLRKFIEEVPDPEPEPIGLQATKRNKIIAF